MEISEHADSIYYADLFRIDSKVFMLTGSGKSIAARIASHENPNDDLARDGVTIVNINGKINGRYDLGAMCKNKPKDTYTFHELDFIAHSLTESQTKQIFSKENRKCIFIVFFDFCVMFLLFIQNWICKCQTQFELR
jgi:hypothetical protein